MGRKPKFALWPDVKVSVRAMIALEHPITQTKVLRSFSSKHDRIVREVIVAMENEGYIEVLGKGTKASPFTIHAKEKAKPLEQPVNPQDDAKVPLVNPEDDTERA
jgi:hypothetical protein